MWRKGFVLQQGKSHILVEFNEKDHCLSVVVMLQEKIRLSKSTSNLLYEIVQIIESLISTFYPGGEVLRQVPFYSPKKKQDIMIPFERVVDSFMKGRTSINFENELINIKSICPDLVMKYLPIVDNLKQTHEVLGKGAKGTVYKGTLDGKEVAIKRIENEQSFSNPSMTPKEREEQLKGDMETLRDFFHEVYIMRWNLFHFPSFFHHF